MIPTHSTAAERAAAVAALIVVGTRWRLRLRCASHRYELHLRDILKETEPDDEACDALCAALDVVQSLCKEQNEARGAHGAPGGSVKPATRRTAWPRGHA